MSRHASYAPGRFQMRVLAVITRTPGLPITALAAELGRPRPTLARAVIGLERRGLITTRLGPVPPSRTGRLCYPAAP